MTDHSITDHDDQIYAAPRRRYEWRVIDGRYRMVLVEVAVHESPGFIVEVTDVREAPTDGAGDV